MKIAKNDNPENDKPDGNPRPKPNPFNLFLILILLINSFGTSEETLKNFRKKRHF
ncbi:hypothetical protein [Thermoanaerobacterium sp. DL9XJH110]|uniref:hypothetical protein n=1 Tax=Thermoanaerobacterium sp. DL9XJH110 TaxID=3386643 RepID=UPI003BB80233